MKKIILSFFALFIFFGNWGAKSVSAEENFEIGLSNLNDSTVEISEPQTREELIADHAQLRGISIFNAEKELFPKQELLKNPLSTRSVQITHYRTFKKYLPNNAGFIYFRVGTHEYQQWRAIVRIQYGGYHSGEKRFSGNFDYYLQHANRIHFTLSGHRYSTGDTTVSGGVSGGLGEHVTATINISRTTDKGIPMFVDSDIYF